MFWVLGALNHDCPNRQHLRGQLLPGRLLPGQLLPGRLLPGSKLLMTSLSKFSSPPHLYCPSSDSGVGPLWSWPAIPRISLGHPPNHVNTYVKDKIQENGKVPGRWPSLPSSRSTCFFQVVQPSFSSTCTQYTTLSRAGFTSVTPPEVLQLQPQVQDPKQGRLQLPSLVPSPALLVPEKCPYCSRPKPAKKIFIFPETFLSLATSVGFHMLSSKVFQNH